jgi:hypothetical protein
MSDRRRRRPWRQSIDGQFAPRRIEMLESPAYRTLSLSARRVIDRIEIELAHHGGNDNGRLPVTYDDFRAYGMDRDAIGPGIREAVALGFIEVKRGRAGNAEFRTPNKYRLTFRHVDRARPTDEWKHISTIEAAEAIARAARRENRTPVGENRTFRSGKSRRKQRASSRGNPDYSHSRKTPTTLDISGDKLGNSPAGASPPRQSGPAGERNGRGRTKNTKKEGYGEENHEFETADGHSNGVVDTLKARGCFMTAEEHEQ